METTVEKLHKLKLSVEKLETVLQEVWSCIDEIGEDENFTELMDKAKEYRDSHETSDEKIEWFNKNDGVTKLK